MLEKLNEKAKGFSHMFTPKVIETQLLFYLRDSGSDTTSNFVDGNISFRFTIKYKCMQSALRGMQSKIFQYYFFFCFLRKYQFCEQIIIQILIQLFKMGMITKHRRE